MKTEEQIKKIEKWGFRVRAQFGNEYGEQYAILTHRFVKGFYIAGDETDWEIMKLHSSGRFAFQEFMFSKDEQEKITSCLKAIKEV